jgi:hypothetical protein
MKQLRSDEARRAFRDLLDDVQRDPDAAVQILRYDKPVAVMVSAEWYERAASAAGDVRRIALDLYEWLDVAGRGSGDAGSLIGNTRLHVIEISGVADPRDLTAGETAQGREDGR